MKKSLLALVLTCTLVFQVAACSHRSGSLDTSASSETNVIEIEVLSGSSDGEAIVSEHGSSDETGRNSYEDKDAPQTAEVVFNGKSYNGEYKFSIVMRHYFHVSDHYSGSGVSFFVNRETSQLESIAIFDQAEEGDKTADECRKIAEEITQQFIDLSQYTLSIKKGDSLRAYHFVRMIDGVATSDVLSVVVRSSGEIVCFNNYTSGKAGNAFSSADPKAIGDVIDRLSSSEVMTMIDNKVNAMYEVCASWSIVNKVLIELENHELGLAYTIDGELEPIRTGENQIMKSGFRIELLVREN